jgi:hypothetical protein
LDASILAKRAEWINMIKRLQLGSLSVGIVVALSLPAMANIPTIDGSQLTEHSNTQNHTNKTKKIQEGTVGNTSGIDCSVHKGDKKADAKDRSGAANKKAGAKTVKQYGGDPATQGSETVTALDGQGRSLAGQIAGQQQTTHGDLGTGSQQLQQLSDAIGTTDTLKGAYDQNSIIALQNGFMINNLIKTSNMWVAAINLINQNDVGSQSTAATATGGVGNSRCVAGTTGQGTSAKPCASKTCETVQLSEASDPGCLTVVYHDSYKNVVIYLLTMEDAAKFQTVFNN